jgi:hypothetical protein
MAKPERPALLAAGSKPRTRMALVLESIALRHQIAVLQRRRTFRLAFVLLIACFGSCCRTAGRSGLKA